MWLFGVGVAFAFLGVGRVERGTALRGSALPWVAAKAGTTMGVGGTGEGCWCRRGSPALAGRAVRDPPLRRGVGGAEVRVAEGEVPAFAGTTVGVRGGVKAGSPILALPQASGGTDLGSAGAVEEKPACRGFLQLRGNDGRGRPFDRLRANGVAMRGGVTRGGCGCGTYVLFWMLFSLGLASGGVGFGSLDRGFARGTHARCVGLWV